MINLLSKLGGDFVVSCSWLGEKASNGKSVGHFKYNYFILFLQRLQGWPDFKCDLLDTDTKFLDDC